MQGKIGRRLVALSFATALLILGSAGAADVSDDEYKTLLDQDVKLLTKALEAVDKAKDKKVAEQRAASGIKSDALYIAHYANSRIGKSAADDAKMAGLRDAAVRLAGAAKKSDFKEIAAIVKELSAPKPAAEAKKIDLIKAFGELSVDDVMHNFKKPNAYGGGWEDEIKAIATAKKSPMTKPDTAAALAQRVLIMADYSKTVVKAENAKEKKEWAEYNDKMEQAAKDLLKAAQAKKADDMVKAVRAIHESCTTCHSAFK